MSESATNEEVVRRYAAASAAGDHDALARLRHPDWCTFWPQSGERVRGTRNFAEIAANDGRIWRETTYWAEPFEAPDWRSPWVERDASAG